MVLRWIVVVWSATLVGGSLAVGASDPPAYVIEAPDILTIEVTGLLKGKAQQVQGEHLVRPDGTISLGTYGSVRVSGLTTANAQAAIAKHLSKYARKKRAVEVRVVVEGFNSKHYYLVKPGAAGEDVGRIPLTGNETVLDAVSQVKGLAAVAAKGRVEVVRDGKVLVVNWRAITRKSQLATNYKLTPGDLVRVAGPSE